MPGTLLRGMVVLGFRALNICCDQMYEMNINKVAYKLLCYVMRTTAREKEVRSGSGVVQEWIKSGAGKEVLTVKRAVDCRRRLSRSSATADFDIQYRTSHLVSSFASSSFSSSASAPASSTLRQFFHLRIHPRHHLRPI